MEQSPSIFYLLSPPPPTTHHPASTIFWHQSFIADGYAKWERWFEKYLAVSYVVKYTFSIQAIIPLLGIYQEKGKTVSAHRLVHEFHDDQRLETTQMAISWQMDKQDMVSPLNRTQLSNGKEGTTDTRNIVAEPQRHYGKWKRPDTEGHILVWFHLYDILEEAKLSRY